MEVIDKSAIIAEIKKRVNEYPCDNSEQNIGYHCALYEMQDFLNNLEVKEMDLDRAIDKWIDDAAITHEDCSIADVINTAKHFFKLGLKAKGE